MVYKVGQLTSFLNEGSTKGSGLEDRNVKKKKVKKKQLNQSDQSEKAYKTTESQNSFQTVALQSYTKRDELELTTKLAKTKKNKTSKKKFRMKKRKNDELEVEIESTENDETNIKGMAKIIRFEEAEDLANIRKQHTENKKRKYRNISENEEKCKRTVFVGNIPIMFKKQKIKTIFKACGTIESFRIRSAAPVKPTLPKRVAVIKNLYHPEVNSYNAYVVFKTEQMAIDALKLNGTKIQDNHIRVDSLNSSQKHDSRKSVFVGNLPYNVEDEELWEFFQKCGGVVNVRVIRDRATRIGKGFGYVLFKSVGAINLAVKMDGEELKGRPLRISRATNNEKKPQRKNRAVKNQQTWKFQGMTATEKQKIKKTKKMIKLKTEARRKKEIANKLQFKNIQEKQKKIKVKKQTV